MYRTILLPLDGSDVAEAALPLAARIARSAHARLHLLLVHQPITVPVEMTSMPVTTADFDEELRTRERGYLAGRVAELGQVGDGPVEVHHTDGSPGPDVCAEATRLGADLIVMATHGRGAVGRFWLGSVADYVVRHTTLPVLLVHVGAGARAPADRPIKEILVALDLSPHSEAILEPAIALARVSQAALTLFHVVEPFHEIAGPRSPYPEPQDPVLLESSRTETERLLGAAADRLRERGLAVSIRVVVGSGSVAGTVLQTLEEPGYDLVALTTHGARGLQRMLLGSVADKIIRGAGKPVLVLRPPPAPGK